MKHKSKNIGKVLMVDDDLDVLDAARLFLKRNFSQVDVVSQPEEIPDLLANESYDIILLDMNFTGDVSAGKEGFYWLNKILEIDPTAVVVLVTAYGDIELAVKAMKEGATDFVLKPWENQKLLATLLSALRLKESRTAMERLRSGQQELQNEIEGQQDIIGQSEPMLKIFRMINKVAKTDANVLILGENGTGKELVARAIHRNSNRSSEIFVNVDLGAISETLFESELFGHVKGAFTDAKEDRIGRFEVANGGTLFLDEIGNLSLPLQAKLLTALQNKVITRVGSSKPIAVDVRFVFATNMPLYVMVNKGEFRQDLLYRINTLELQIPSLRERPEDIPLLASYFLNFYSSKYNKTFRSLSDAMVNRMKKYAWMGNVRELQHVMERAVVLSTGQTIDLEHLFINTARKKETESQDDMSFSNFELDHVEKMVIQKVMKKHQGSITNAAKELGLTRTSLYRRLEKYGI